METQTLVAVLIPYLLLVYGFTAYCLVDVHRAESVRYLPTWAWSLICLLWAPFGGLVYLFAGRDR